MSDHAFVWSPPPELVRDSNITHFLAETGIANYDDLLTRAEADPQWFWQLIIGKLTLSKAYIQLLDVSRGPEFPRWCVGAEGNIVLDCLDRHRNTEVWQKEFLAWESETGDKLSWTYADLHREVCLLANALESLGVRQGEVVGLFLPNIPHALAAFLACAKRGIIAMPLFSGFGANALADRLNAAGAVALVTADGTFRRGTVVSMKSVADEAAAKLDSLKHVLVIKNCHIDVAWHPKRDRWLSDFNENPGTELPTLQLRADAPLMLMYTSGTTGKPKGTIHTHIGFAAKMLLDMGLVMDLKPSDKLLWMSDMGWLVGPMVAVAVPLQGASVVLAEGSPDYPDKGRMWRLIDEHRVSFLGLAPTTARTFMRNQGGGIERYTLSSLRVCVSTGEVWTPEAWHWTFDSVCKRRVPLLNYSGGTEIGGGILCGTVVHPIKPCTFSRAIPGMGASILDESGQQAKAEEVGELVLTSPSPGLTRGLWRSDETYLKSYWSRYPGIWQHGDWAIQDADGWWQIMGRSDDTLKIAGKRTGPSEIEALLSGTGLIVESAVVGVPDPVKGEAVVCVVTLMPGVAESTSTRDALIAVVVSGLGTPFKPRTVVFVDELPKTRNMKVMRRVVRAIFLGQDPGDLSSLVNPEAVQALGEKISMRSIAQTSATGNA
ncbi:MAG: AMP-binding protein [Ottowia sp.]|uniref:AMP-binding protein n=1 Tax=Ottowia sp. TaxID=1898956 RepID=UPI003C71B4B4